MTSTHQLSIIPRDGLFCKDGRGWHTSSSGRGHALPWPWPSTVLGALRTAWGRGEETRSQQRFTSAQWAEYTKPIHMGRTLTLRRELGSAWAPRHRMWPVPADAVWLEGYDDVYALEPRRPQLPTLSIDDDEAREALWSPIEGLPSKPLDPPSWWLDEHFVQWLLGDPEKRVPTRLPENETPRSEHRVQTHVGIDPESLTADEGILFSHEVVETLELRAEWAIGVEVSLPSGPTPPTATVGSDGRIARIESLPSHVFEPPNTLIEAFERGCPGIRLVIATPACFAGGWLPDGFSSAGQEYRGRLPHVDVDLVLRAAMVPRPAHISGWDMTAKGGRGAPKETSRMVPPGAVYFFERTDGRPFGKDVVHSLWLASIGSRTTDGYGRVVPGAWFPK